MAFKHTNETKRFIKYVEEKLSRYEKEEKNMGTLFRYMFSEEENVMAEISDGYKIKAVTYKECKNQILSIIPSLKSKLGAIETGSLVGLCMENSIEWLQIFWAILALGYKPCLFNLKLNDETLERVIAQYEVKAVVSDGKVFSALTICAKDLYCHASKNKAEICELTFENEVVFMSSGTTDNVKLCSYRGKNFYYQIKDSAKIAKSCPDITKGSDGKIKQLALLPFYHVFGFIAVYLWFGFFASVFVFLKDMRPKTILNTIRRHKVSHVFAVPLVWEKVYKEVLNTVRNKGEKTKKRFEKAIKIASTSLGKKLMRPAFSDIRYSTFGDSVKFMISGGSHVSGEVLNFFNAIGYHLCNGYGMTEIGIASVELENDVKILSSQSVGKPFSSVEYMLNENGELCVRGKSVARKISVGGVETVNDYDAWFNTKDLAKELNGRYYVLGRADDLVVGESGENLNPVIVENSLRVKDVEEVCLITDENSKPTVILSCPNCYTSEKARDIKNAIREKLALNKLDGQIAKIEITTDRLLDAQDFKISRKKVKNRYCDKKLRLVSQDEDFTQSLSALEMDVRKCFATALKIDESEIYPNSDFFSQLGGNSLDYLELADLIKSELGVSLPVMDGVKLVTVKQVCDFIIEYER